MSSLDPSSDAIKIQSRRPLALAAESDSGPGQRRRGLVHGANPPAAPGRARDIMRIVKRRGTLLLLVVLPDGICSLIPASWTDWPADAADPFQSGPQPDLFEQPS